MAMFHLRGLKRRELSGDWSGGYRYDICRALSHTNK